MNWLKKPENRVKASWYMFWLSIALGVYCTVFVAKGGFERILMAISWGAITITCIDVIVSTDIRKEVDK